MFAEKKILSGTCQEYLRKSQTLIICSDSRVRLVAEVFI